MEAPIKKKKRDPAIADVTRRLDQIIENTSIHLPEMVGIQIELARSSSRCATRQRAAAKVIDWHVQALAMRADLAEPDVDEETQGEKVKVLVMSREDVEMARQRATAFRDAELKKLGK